jgi:hypothetical protein
MSHQMELEKVVAETIHHQTRDASIVDRLTIRSKIAQNPSQLISKLGLTGIETWPNGRQLHQNLANHQPRALIEECLTGVENVVIGQLHIQQPHTRARATLTTTSKRSLVLQKRI